MAIALILVVIIHEPIVLCRYAGRWFSIPQRLCLPDELMWSERFEAEGTSRRSSCAHRVDVLPAHMLVPVLLKRPGWKSGTEDQIEKCHYLSSPSPPSSARIDSLSSRLLVEVTGVGLFVAKLVPPEVTAGYLTDEVTVLLPVL